MKENVLFALRALFAVVFAVAIGLSLREVGTVIILRKQTSYASACYREVVAAVNETEGRFPKTRRPFALLARSLFDAEGFFLVMKNADTSQRVFESPLRVSPAEVATYTRVAASRRYDGRMLLVGDMLLFKNRIAGRKEDNTMKALVGVPFSKTPFFVKDAVCFFIVCVLIAIYVVLTLSGMPKRDTE